MTVKPVQTVASVFFLSHSLKRVENITFGAHLPALSFYYYNVKCDYALFLMIWGKSSFFLRH